MGLSDSQLDAIVALTEDISTKFGIGIVLLLIGEIRQYRAAELHDMQQVVAAPKPDLAKTSATDLLKEVTTCINQNEPLRDADVLALFHALQNRQYFQTTCLVDRESLKKLIYALSAPEQPHLILEMQHTRGLPRAEGERLNPIDQLIVDLRRVTHASD